MSPARYDQGQLAAFGGFCGEVRSLLEVGVGLRARRLMEARPHSLRVFWEQGSSAAACAKALRTLPEPGEWERC